MNVSRLKFPYKSSSPEGKNSGAKAEQQRAQEHVYEKWETVAVASLLESESKNLALRIPFWADRKRSGESKLWIQTGSNPQPGRIMFTEIESEDSYVGELYRNNGEIVFEPAEFPKGLRLFFSRESFHAIFEAALEDLKRYPDVFPETE